MCCVRRWEVQDHHRLDRVHELLGWNILGISRRDACLDVSCMRDRDILSNIRRSVVFDVPAVPGERGVRGGERVSGVLHMSERVRACGRHVDVPDLRPRHVQQPARAHGVLELLAGSVLGELRRDGQRDVFELCAWRMVAGGQPELQFMPGELVHWSKKWVANKLRLQRGVHRAERRPVLGMRCGPVQNRDRLGSVHQLPRRRVFDCGGSDQCDGMHQLPGGGVFGCLRREQCERVRFLSGRYVLGRCRREQRERVCFLPNGGLLKRNRREQRGYVCAMSGRGVFGSLWCNKREYVCFMLTRVVLEPDRIERVCVMPGGGVVFRGGLRIDCKLLVHRRVLRERCHVHGLPDLVVVCRGIHVYRELLLQRRIFQRQWRVCDLSVPVIILTCKSKYIVLWMHPRKNARKHMSQRHCVGARTVVWWCVQCFAKVHTRVEYGGTRRFPCARWK